MKPDLYTKAVLTVIAHTLTSRRVTVALIALAWSSPAFCGKIHDAAQNCDLTSVKALLKQNPALVFSKDDNAIRHIGGTPLHVAATFDCKDVAEFLLANHAEVNAMDNDGNTPLFWAVEWGHSVVELLLVNHADPNTKDENGLTPLHEATRMGQKHLVELLLAYKAHVNATDPHGYTPLHMAAAYGRKDEAEVLLANKAAVDAKANDGRTPLHEAAWKAWPGVAELLLTNHADVNAKDNNAYTPLHLALNVWDGWDEDAPTRPTRAKAVAALLRRHGGHE